MVIDNGIPIFQLSRSSGIYTRRNLEEDVLDEGSIPSSSTILLTNGGSAYTWVVCGYLVVCNGNVALLAKNFRLCGCKWFRLPLFFCIDDNSLIIVIAKMGM